jgi:anaerobic dimethyl sulfoxide reductase subunit B (iron-sulfur subunit)
MKRHMFLFDRTRCFGCNGCVAACASTHGTPPELHFRKLFKLPPEDGASDTAYLTLACNHCVDAPCVKVCPSGAMHHDHIQGLVAIDAERCIGCRYCEMACPYDAIRFDPRTNVVSKCDFCADRLAENKEPACVATCFSSALQHRWVEVDEEPEGHSREVPGFTHHPGVGPMIRFADEMRLARRGEEERR